MRRRPLLHRVHDFFLPHARNGYHPALLELAAVALLVGFVLLFEVAFLMQGKFAFEKHNFLASVLPGAVVALANTDRAATDLSALQPNSALDAAAQMMAEDMAMRGYFSHVSPEGEQPWHWLDKAGYAYSYAGQNLAVHFSDSDALERAWMESPTHRANILNSRYQEIGVGIASGMYEGKQTTFVVQFFAAPKVAQKVSARAPEPKTAEEVTNQAPSPAVLGVSTSNPELSFFAQILASPHTTLNVILITLFTFFLALLVFGSLLHMRLPHPSAVVNCLVLLAILGLLIFLNASTFVPPLLPDSSAVASVP